MLLKEILFCASVLIIQSISAQCGCNPGVVLAGPPCGCANVYTRPCAASLTVSTCPLAAAPNIPAGMSIASENLLISGPVVVAGKLPFSGTVALEGALPAHGAGSVSYGCGCGDAIAVFSEAPLATGIVGPGYGGCGCGYGGIVY